MRMLDVRVKLLFTTREGYWYWFKVLNSNFQRGTRGTLPGQIYKN